VAGRSATVFMSSTSTNKVPWTNTDWPKTRVEPTGSVVRMAPVEALIRQAPRPPADRRQPASSVGISTRSARAAQRPARRGRRADREPRSAARRACRVSRSATSPAPHPDRTTGGTRAERHVRRGAYGSPDCGFTHTYRCLSWRRVLGRGSAAVRSPNRAIPAASAAVMGARGLLRHADYARARLLAQPVVGIEDRPRQDSPAGGPPQRRIVDGDLPVAVTAASRCAVPMHVI
jgi:hypothetical protein